MFHVDEANNVIAYGRWSRDDKQDAVVVIINLSHVTHDDYALGFPAPGPWRVVLNTDAGVYSSGFAGRGPAAIVAEPEPRHPLAATARLQLPGYTALLLARASQER